MRRSGYRAKPVHVIRENGDITENYKVEMQDDYDIKVFQYRKQQAELKRYISKINFSFQIKKNFVFRNQQEEDLRENHPFFDTPLFTIIS